MLDKVIKDTLRGLMVYETMEDDRKFLWKDAEQIKAYREFRVKEKHRRNLEDISTIEYSNGVLQIMKTAFRLPKADLMREISKQLGYSRTSTKAEVYVQRALDLNVEKGWIREDSEGYIEFIGD